MRAQRIQGLSERIGGVGVVDEHLRARGMAGDPLEPTAHAAQSGERTDRSLGSAPHATTSPRAASTLAAWKPPTRPRRARYGRPSSANWISWPSASGVWARKPQPLGLPPVVEHGDAATAADRGQRRVLRLIGIEHGGTLGRQELAEQPALGGQVFGEAAVIIEVVA